MTWTLEAAEREAIRLTELARTVGSRVTYRPCGSDADGWEIAAYAQDGSDLGQVWRYR